MEPILVVAPDAIAAPRPASRLRLPRLSVNALLLLVAIYVATMLNQSFWQQVLHRLPGGASLHDAGMLLALFIALCVLELLILAPFSARRLIRPAAAALILLAAGCAYFMDSYGTVIDAAMISNLFQTDPREASELMGAPLLLHLLFTGVLPAALVLSVPLRTSRPLAELGSRLLLILTALLALLAAAVLNYKPLSLWARENRDVRLYVNPSYPLHSLRRYLHGTQHQPRGPVLPVAVDAQRAVAASGKPRVLILVVGETARAMNHGLLGYTRNTNPELAAEPGVQAFSEVWSCGTATAYSLPCMFSRLGRSGFSRSKAGAEESLLDVLQKTGVDVLWRDNNSDCKGVCDRVPHEDLRKRSVPAICNEEGCFDEVLLDGLDERLLQARGDSLIALHVLGSHGPSYYKRYPPAFRRFTPACEQNDVQNCNQASIINAYDNTVLYTDHVLAQLIALLRRHADRIEPTLIYLSDHGESLGENGIYLHGLPYALAPDEQKRVPMFVWAPSRDQACIAARRARPTSHDALFPTVLGLFDIRTHEYRPALDLLRGC